MSKFYLIFFPGLMLFLTILAVNFLGDALRDAFDPQSTR
jgi:ABC-type dipeptide/oligopeptide/nickel transport system permease subunit